MREIIFRGKGLDDEWHYGWLIKQGPYHFIQNNSGGNVAVIETTIGQFTGLLDRNGKRIFEGDVVRMWNGNKSDIKHVDGYWCVSKKNRQIHWTEWKDFEVIGTIHGEIGKEV